MKAITLKGIPEPLYREIKKRAKAMRRSLNAEVLVALEQSVGSALLTPAERLARLDAIRERVTRPYLTKSQIDAGKREGRA
jgi:hypothetical protein